MNAYSIILSLLLFPLLYSCEEPIKWALEAGENQNLVVESILTDEMAIQEVKLSLSFDSLNGSPTPVLDAIVKVNANGISYNFSESAATDSLGYYLSEIPFRVVNDLLYELEIVWQGESYFAESRLAPVAPIPELLFSNKVNSDSLFFNGIDSLLFNPNQEAMYEMNIDWRHIENEGIREARFVFYTFNTINGNALFRPSRERVFFPSGSIVMVQKFGLNEAFADYLQAVASETEWNGGPINEAPANVPTNINNGGLGFFSTCSILRDTFIVE